MKRITMMVLRCIIFVPFWIIKLKLWSKNDKHSEVEKFQFVQKLTTKANKAGRIKVIATGSELLPKEQGYIMFPNHQGFFDVLAFLETSPNPFSAVIKKEAMNWPLVRTIRLYLKMLTLDREDPRDGIRVINEMTKQTEEGRNYIIFAEGTRSREGNTMGIMKAGSFKSAMKAKCPIVPVALIDCFKPFDTSTIRPVTVWVHYMEPIYYEEYQGLRSVDIAKLVQERITDRLELELAKVHSISKTATSETDKVSRRDESGTTWRTLVSDPQRRFEGLSGKSILLCEDQPIDRQIMVKLLKEAGMIVTCAEDGEQGISIFQQCRENYFHLILMDVRMPGMDGIVATKEIRQMDRPDAKKIPIVALTGNAYESDEEATRVTGMDAYVAKPVQVDELYRCLKRLLAVE